MYDIKKLDLKINKLVDSNFVGNYKTAFKWKWIEFLDYDKYEYWEDSKNIDFLKSEIEQKLVVKRYIEERELRVVFVIDLNDSMYFWLDKKNKILQLLKTFYFLAYSAIKNNDRVELFLFDEEKYEYIKLSKSKQSIFLAMQKIKDFKKSKKLNKLDKNIWDYLKWLKIKKSLIFYLTDEIKLHNFQKYLAYWNDLVYINIFDDFENNLQKKWIFNIWFNWKNLFLNSNSKKIEKYKTFREKKVKNFQKNLKTSKIDYLKIESKTNTYLLLLNFFHNRKSY